MPSNGSDQCWSWVIAMSAFVIKLLLSGLSRASGVFFVAIIGDYGVSRFEASLPFTVRSSVRNLSGPLVGMGGQRYGVQKVTLIGAMMASLGLIFCYFAPNVFWITIFWGGLHGLGVALANTISQVTINQYFEKYRATATGLALSGACIGSFILPIILDIILTNYGLSGTFLIAGGLVMHIFPATIFFKEPKWLTKGKLVKALPCPDEEKTEKRLSPIPDSGVPVTSLSSNDWHGKVSSKAVSQKKENCDSEPLTPLTVENRFNPLCADDVPIWRSVLRIYKNPMFQLISVNWGILAISSGPLSVVIMDYSHDKGLEVHKGRHFISALAFGDLIGALCFGWVTDRNYITLPKFMLTLQVIQGICLTVITFSSNFMTILLAIIVHGVSLGNTRIMKSVLVGKYLPNEQSLAMGCIAFFSGLISFSVPPLIGHFRDGVGSYDGMFRITGGLSILSGLMWLLEPWIMRFGPYRSRNNHVNLGQAVQCINDQV